MSIERLNPTERCKDLSGLKASETSCVEGEVGCTLAAFDNDTICSPSDLTLTNSTLASTGVDGK